MKVGIIGMGVVGKANATFFSRTADVVTYDPKDNSEYPYNELSQCEFAVICVPTPAQEHGGVDISMLDAAMMALPPDVPVMVRSTVPPSLLKHWETGDNFCHVPEFIGENKHHPWQRCIDVPFMILGGTLGARSFFRPHLESAYPWPVEFYECSVSEAALIKYTGNLHWATRVTFVNQMSALCDAFDVDWEKVRDGWIMDKRVNPAYTTMRGMEPGFRGACWPKDLVAMIDNGLIETPFLEAIQEANDEFRNT